MARRASFAIATAVVLALAAPALKADSVAWDKIVGADAGKLSAAQKARASALLSRVANAWGCKGTMAACLAAGDETARRYSGIVVRMVRKDKSDADIEKALASRKASAHPTEIARIDLAGHPFLGPHDAKVVVVEYACFECPFCAHLAPDLKRLTGMFKGKVAYSYKFYPVRSHEHGVAAALAGAAALRQGRFWEMADVMFTGRANLTDADLLSYAQNAGLDLGRFKADLKDPALMKLIEKDKLEGMSLGVEGTPTFFVNGKLYEGASDFEEIADRVAEEIDIAEGRIP
ncbi:MAG: DsbA family protein [Deltaproteobacteria bacterium]|nr:DsbA family protein [Deltaproteobacteria bacterium]